MIGNISTQTKTSCFLVLNYLAFFVLYIVSFVYTNQKYSEIIGYGILFVVHAAFTFYVMNSLLSVFSDISKPKILATFSILSIIIGLVFQFVSILLVVMMISNMQVKYTAKHGTPLRLSDNNREKLDDFRNNLITVFSFITFLLVIFFSKDFQVDRTNSIYSNYMDISLQSILDINTFSKFIKKIPSFIILGSSCVVLATSSKQVYIANDLSSLHQKQLIT